MVCMGYRLNKLLIILRSPLTTGGAETDGADYAGALSQVVFRGVARATADVSLIFGKDAKELACLLVGWALKVAAHPPLLSSSLSLH
jgi:hypothetical protein